MSKNYFWFRRDLRFYDNLGLSVASNIDLPLVCLFIFDENIISQLPKDDRRISFIYNHLKSIDEKLREKGSSLRVERGNPDDVFRKIFDEENVSAVFLNEDYEPNAIARDAEIQKICDSNHVKFESFKDQVVFGKEDVLKNDGTPYTVFTPFKKRWLAKFDMNQHAINYNIGEHFDREDYEFPSLENIGFTLQDISMYDQVNWESIDQYDENRNFPAVNGTTYLGVHLRFGTVSSRQLIRKFFNVNQTFVSELIWREFFMQILYHFPKVIDNSFKKKYDVIAWRNDEEEFLKWCKGETGYGIVDAGMRQLNETGWMHNRVRMVVASFLCKHLLIDWRWGEAYFAEKLMDYDLSANNGNWQWAAGTGCDAAPYFRVFNPYEQVKKFDRQLEYIKKWVPEYDSLDYQPIVDHKFARERALTTYKEGLAKA